MKKLMLTVAAVALAGAATASNVFDYKASVKYVDFKKVKVQGVNHFVKQVKSTSVTGYLVTPENCPCDYDANTATALRDPGFLVVTSSLAKKFSKDSLVKLLPANLLVEAWSTKNIGTAKKATLEAQGYLFAGLGKRDVPAPGSAGAYTAGSPDYGFGDLNVTEATRFLFGEGNDHDYDAANDAYLFIEPFLDAAGFGKASFGDDREAQICGTSGDVTYCLKNLAGSVIGGSWTCVGNFYYEEWRCQGWNNAQETNSDTPSYDYSGLDYKYNVISGTWSIKANTKIEEGTLSKAEQDAIAASAGLLVTETEIKYVKACGVKLDKNFDLTTFDAKTKFPGAFTLKWMGF